MRDEMRKKERAWGGDGKNLWEAINSRQVTQ